MAGLMDKDGNPVEEKKEPKAQCDQCRHIAPVSKFLGDEPDDDACPICFHKHWTFV